MILNFLKPHKIFKMAAPIPPMLKYSIGHNFLNSPPILIKFVSKFMDCKVLYFEAQCALRLRSPLTSSHVFLLIDTVRLCSPEYIEDNCIFRQGHKTLRTRNPVHAMKIYVMED